MLLLFISFIAGVLTVLAPCILPLLPVIVGGSLAGGSTNRKKALTIVVSLGISVILFTLLLKASTAFISIPQDTWKFISGGIILFIGLAIIFPSLWENRLLSKLSAKSNTMLGQGNRKSGFWGDVIVGAALGPVFSTCSPTYFIVLATVLPVSPVLGMIYLLAYAIGLCLSLLLIALVGQKIIGKLGIASDPKGTLKRVLGIIFVFVGIAILTGFDKKIETGILDSGFFDVTKIEQRLLDQQNDSDQKSPGSSIDSSDFLTLEQKSAKFDKAPELSSIDGYINTDGKSITLAELRGEVVLLDVWTYSCINCQRTLPYLNEWYDKYKDQGLEIVGLHTPEFSFEKVRSNVQDAVNQFDIKYPVVMDNDFSTWIALGNRYWPRKYLIDIDGYIVYDHIGEGGYDETEKAIQEALRERSFRLGLDENISSDETNPDNVIAVDPSKVKSPEIYFGSARNSHLANGDRGVNGAQTLSVPSSVQTNGLYLGGAWNFTPEYAENTGEATIVFAYEAKNVYMAAGSDNSVEIEIYQDDTFIKKITVDNEQLYTLITGFDYGRHVLKVKILGSGLKAFTFTFG